MACKRSAIALVQAITNDWFVTGRVVSFVAASVTVIATYWFFRRVLSESAAIGSIVVLAAPPVFVTYSALASSDVFFLGMYALCLLMAMRAATAQSNPFWFITGFVIGISLLSRTNAISILVILIVPWLEFDWPVRRRLSARRDQ